MSSPYICLSKAAIKAKLTQNESLIFHALMVQTLGYRKTNDNLTDKRLAQLSGIRLDHFRVALDSFLQHNLFYRIEHPSYDYQYRICDEFLDDEHTTTVYPPSLPKSGQVREVRVNAPEVGADSPQTLVDLPEVGGHTTENLNIKKPQQTNQTEKKPFLKKQQTKTKHKKPKKTKKTKKNKQQKQHTKPLVSVCFSSLDVLSEQLLIESDQPIRLALTVKDMGNIAQTVEETTEETTEKITDKTIEKAPEINHEQVLENKAEKSTVPEPIVETETTNAIETEKMPSSTTARSMAALAKQLMQSSETSQPVEVEQVDTQEQHGKPSQPKPRNALPKVISEEYVNACQNHFDVLNDQQQKDVLNVFFQHLKAGTIKNKGRYFIGLAKKSKQGTLVVPQESITKDSPPAYSPEAFAQAKEADKEREQRAMLWSDYQWLKQQAIAQEKTEQELAVQVNMEDAYALFHSVEQEVACVV